MKMTRQPAALILGLAVLLSGIAASPLAHLIFGPSGNEISVRIVGPGRAPIQGAEVVFFAKGGPFKGVTSTLGAARLSIPSPGGRLVVQSPGFKIHEELFNRLPDDYLDIELRPRETDAGRVLFRIVESASGEGVAGAEVLLIQGARSYNKVSDSDGLVDFLLDFVKAEAEVRITIEALGFAFSDHRLTVRPDSSQDVVLNRRDQTLSLSPFGSR